MRCLSRFRSGGLVLETPWSPEHSREDQVVEHAQPFHEPGVALPDVARLSDVGRLQGPTSIDRAKGVGAAGQAAERSVGSPRGGKGFFWCNE